MEENKNYDLDSIMEELSIQLEDMIEGVIIDQVDSAVTSAIQDVLPGALYEGLSSLEFVLKDGTIIRPKQHMKVLSPDKSRLCVCYGGVRVDGSCLVMQTGIGRWEMFTGYRSREEALAALTKIKEAMESGVSICEL